MVFEGFLTSLSEGTKQAERAPGVARAACFEALAGVFASADASTFILSQSILTLSVMLSLKLPLLRRSRFLRTKHAFKLLPSLELPLSRTLKPDLDFMTVLRAPRLAKTPGQPLETDCASFAQGLAPPVSCFRSAGLGDREESSLTTVGYLGEFSVNSRAF